MPDDILNIFQDGEVRADLISIIRTKLKDIPMNKLKEIVNSLVGDNVWGVLLGGITEDFTVEFVIDRFEDYSEKKPEKFVNLLIDAIFEKKITDLFIDVIFDDPLFNDYQAIQ